MKIDANLIDCDTRIGFILVSPVLGSYQQDNETLSLLKM